MKLAFIKALLLATVSFQWTPLRAEDSKPVSYEPTVVTLSGTIVEEGYGDDPSPIDRGKFAWILRLERTISAPATPDDEINTEERNVKEIHLNVSHAKYPIPKDAFGKTRFTATGTLYLFLLGLSCQGFSQTPPKGFEGWWQGTLEAGGTKLRLVLTVTKSDAVLTPVN
jgi:hypothetical protein